MWIGHTAIPAIAPYARVPERSIEYASGLLAADAQSASALLAGEYALLQHSQPTLGDRIGDKLSLPLDDAARGLGVTLSLVVWRAFEHATPGALRVIEPIDWDNAEQFLQVDEELRRMDPRAMVESDDVIAMLQPEVARFVRKTVDATVRAYDEIDLDDVDAVYRLVLIEVLALSYAVMPPGGADGSGCAPSC